MKSERITSEWYDKIGEKCLNYYKKSHEREIKILKELIKVIPSKSKILDIGCGVGLPTTKFLSNKNHSMIGVDISKKMIGKAKLNVPKAKFRIMSIYNLKFPNKRFNVIVSLFSILHLEKNKLAKVFKKFYNLLDNKGYLLLSFNQGNKEGYFDFFGEKAYYSEYTKKEIENISKKVGFDIIWKKDFLFTKNDKKENQIYYLIQKP